MRALFDYCGFTAGEKGDPGVSGEPGQTGEPGDPGQRGDMGYPGKYSALHFCMCVFLFLFYVFEKRLCWV